MGVDAAQTIGRYQLLARLASGGMAEIYLARQTGIGGFEKLVVVKRILPHLAKEKTFVEMFLDEAVIAAQLNHPNIVQIYDLGQADENYYIAMEYLEGESLGHLASEGTRIAKPLPPGLAAGIVAQICDGLAYAHTFEDEQGQALGIVHRDISPHNVIILISGMVKVVDFGIAKAATKAHQTKVGTLKGKLAYMSPEQCMGSKVDARSDIFSLGVVLWELLTRKRLFKRDVEPAMIRAIMDEPIPKVNEVRADVPASLADIADRALNKKPEDRFQSSAEMAIALRNFLKTESGEAGASQIADYMHQVLGDKARTKKHVLDEIRKKGVDGVSLGVLKPKSDSLPSRSLAGQPGPAAELADAATRIKTDTDEVKPRTWWKTVVPFFILGIAAAVLVWWMAGPTSGPQPETSDPIKPTRPIQKDAGPVAVQAPQDTSAALPADAGTAPPTREPVLLSVRSTPQGCAIELDGLRLSGSTPLHDHPVEPGRQHSVAVLCKGYPKKTKTISGQPGEKPSLSFSLKPQPKPVKPAKPPVTAKVKPGKLTLDTKPWTEVYLGKRKLGLTPLLGIELPAGRHKLTIVNQGRGIREKIEVIVKAGQTTTIRKTLIK
jgi:eukaryotic-like serine/threonine-protein kinase